MPSSGTLRAGWPAVALLAAFVMPAAAQQPVRLDQRSSIAITLPEAAPVAVVGADWGDSVATQRGGSMLLELRTSLVLRNASRQAIRSITLQVAADEGAPGSRGSVAVPSLSVAPGQTFSVRVDVQLIRPLQRGTGPLVHVTLDGVLFEDLSFYGPDRLNSHRTMMGWEVEARRDRRHFRAMLESRGQEALQQELLASLSRQAEQSQMEAQIGRGSGRATVMEAEREITVAALSVPDAPVELVDGVMRVAGSQARSPQLAVRNRTHRPVRALQLGWLLKDVAGREYLGGSISAEVPLGAYQQGRVAPDHALRFSQRSGSAIEIDDVMGVVQQVEFQDGSVWVPGRAALGDLRLRRALPVSPEEQRLSQLYRRRGLSAVVEELKRF